MSFSKILFSFNGRLAGMPLLRYRLLTLVMTMLPVSIGYLIYFPAQAKAEEIASAGALSFFADEEDARILLGRLNGDPEIAFMVPDGPRMPPPNERMPVSPPRGDRPPTGVVLVMRATCGWGWDGYWQRWRALRPVRRAKGWRAYSLAHFCGTAARQRRRTWTTRVAT